MSRRPVQFGLGDLTRWPELVAAEPAPPAPFEAPAFPGVPRVFLHSGSLVTAAIPTLVTTILGSCVAVCAFDPARGIGGLNHFLLPWEAEPGAAPHRHARTAIAALIRDLEALGLRRSELQAKVFGGASVLDAPVHGAPLGARNVLAARDCLMALGIPVVAEDAGGNRGRKLFFHTADGSAWVRKL